MIKQVGKNKYRLIVSVGSGASRRKHTKTVSCNGKKEAKKLYDDFEAEILSEAPASDITIGNLLEAHIAHTKILGRKQTTIRGYEIAEKRFQSRFKSILAKDCTAYHIEKQITLMANKGLSAKTIKNTIGLLSAAYEHAIRSKQLPSNPCKFVTMPKGKQREIRILYMDEIQDFLYALSDVQLDEKVAYYLALFMGLRRSEILGLKESDIGSGMLYVHNTRHRVGREDYESDTKTKRSTRVLAMPEIVQLEVAKLIAEHQAFEYEKTDYLVQNGFGEPLNPQALASRLRRLEVKHNLPLVSLHGLRHTYASLLHSQGIEMARISAELGHTNLTTTANLYVKMFQNASQSSRGIASTINSLELSTGQKKLSTSKPSKKGNI